MSVVAGAKSFTGDLLEGMRRPHNSVGKVAFGVHWKVLAALSRHTPGGKINVAYHSELDQLEAEAVENHNPEFWAGFIYYWLIATTLIFAAVPIYLVPESVFTASADGSLLAAVGLAVVIYYFVLMLLAAAYAWWTLDVHVEGDPIE